MSIFWAREVATGVLSSIGHQAPRPIEICLRGSPHGSSDRQKHTYFFPFGPKRVFELEPATPRLYTKTGTRPGPASISDSTTPRNYTAVVLFTIDPLARSPRTTVRRRGMGFRAPLNVKYDNFSRASDNYTSGLVGPHTTPPIVEIKYMTSALREGYFGLPVLGSEYY
jgi:hypothetical protein